MIAGSVAFLERSSSKTKEAPWRRLLRLQLKKEVRRHVREADAPAPASATCGVSVRDHLRACEGFGVRRLRPRLPCHPLRLPLLRGGYGRLRGVEVCGRGAPARPQASVEFGVRRLRLRLPYRLLRLRHPRGGDMPRRGGAVYGGELRDHREACGVSRVLRPRRLPFRHLQCRLPGEADSPAEAAASGADASCGRRAAYAVLASLRFRFRVRPECFQLPYFYSFGSWLITVNGLTKLWGLLTRRTCGKPTMQQPTYNQSLEDSTLQRSVTAM